MSWTNIIISLNYAHFLLNKNHIQAKFNELARWREAIIRVLLVYLDYFGFFQSLRFMQIMSRIMRNLEEGYFFKKK